MFSFGKLIKNVNEKIRFTEDVGLFTESKVEVCNGSLALAPSGNWVAALLTRPNSLNIMYRIHKETISIAPDVDLRCLHQASATTFYQPVKVDQTCCLKSLVSHIGIDGYARHICCVYCYSFVVCSSTLFCFNSTSLQQLTTAIQIKGNVALI